MGPIPWLPRHHRPLRSALRDGGLRQHAYRLEGDGGGARVQGRPAGAEEGRGEGGDRGGGKGAADKRTENKGEGGQERHVAPPRTLQRQLSPPLPPAGERETRSGEGRHGERSAHCHCSQGGCQEARCQARSDH